MSRATPTERIDAAMHQIKVTLGNSELNDAERVERLLKYALDLEPYAKLGAMVAERFWIVKMAAQLMEAVIQRDLAGRLGFSLRNDQHRVPLTEIAAAAERLQGAINDRT